MSQALLVTLMCDGASNTFTFDPAVSSLLYVGTSRAADRAHAWAMIEAGAKGSFLRAARGFVLVAHDGTTPERVSMDDVEELVLRMQTIAGDRQAVLYIRRSTPGARTYSKIGFSYDADLMIGRNEGCAVRYASPLVSGTHARLTLTGDTFTITDLGSSNGTFVNGLLLAANQAFALVAGDVVQVLDLVIMVGHRFITINHPRALSLAEVEGMVAIDHDAFRELCPPASDVESDLPLFYPAPRLTHSIHAKAFQVDDPPQKKREDDQPAIMQLGPSFIMGLASVFMVVSAIARIQAGGSILSGAPMIAMSVSMMAGMLLWPIINRNYTKKRDEREEVRRETRYTDYLNTLEATFKKECESQAEVLRTNRADVVDLMNRAQVLSPRLMNRATVHDDFMDLRVGTGTTNLEADFHWPQRRFSMDDDKLLDKVTAISKNPPKVHDVPLAFDPAEHSIAGVLGPHDVLWSFMRGLIIQTCAFYSYQDLKIILIADDEDEPEWAFLRAMPHLFDDSGEQRYLATSFDSLTAVSLVIDRELEARREQRVDSVGEYGVYYVVICASKELAERSDAVSRLVQQRTNYGFSLLFMGQQLRDLPRECGYVVDLSASDLSDAYGVSSQSLNIPAVKAGEARMFDRDDVSGTMETFTPDILVSREDAHSFALDFVRARLDMPAQRTQLPSSVGFLEMFQVGNIAQLNIGQRWAEGDGSRTLATPVGLDAAGEHSILNLHENVHGPHGLIAGTTGSGKSEFIITYVLSMAVNYAPDEAAFVLIDYKGGGLAGAFDNERYRLPHLAGTITNLDGAAIARSLVSIKSELKRRQDAFNRAREITGEATMDIYKYLRAYRAGTLTEPLPHLFIVADEFAELKQQEPEFMDELISAARIGRSLGVHLILATQKPTGVVNDQIWSNSRFKVCLKVADAADSKEMLRRPDAAEIKGPGRFYLLVGYNESFSSGQAAYAGAGYAPTDEFEPKRDDAVDLIDDSGQAVATLRPPRANTKTGESEMNTVLEALMRTADAQHLHAQRLWLDPLPTHIVLDELVRTNDWKPSEDGLTVMLGQVDDPSRQRQFPYILDILAAGNVLLYGSQASGIDALAGTILYALAEAYGPDRVAYYVADLGTGALMPFSSMPQCGGVLLANDTERMANLFRLIEGEIDRRRMMLAAAGCDFERYEATAEERPVRMVVLITNISAFYELYAAYEDRLTAIARDAPRYGIHLILTANSANAARMRLRASFGLSIMGMLNDSSDFVTLLGKKPKAPIPEHEKRCLVVVENETFEMQGASICQEGEADAPLIEQLGKQLSEATPLRARPIPVLPRRVHAEDMQLPLANSKLIPVGFARSTVEPMFFDANKSPVMLVLGNDLDFISRYLRGMHQTLKDSGNVNYTFIDPQGLLGETDDVRHVLTTDTTIVPALANIEKGKPCDVLVFTSIMQTMAGLPGDASKSLQDYIAQERGVGRTALVACSELWRTRNNYDPWYKVLSAYGNGIWAGSGMGDQTVFRMARVLSEYRQPAKRSDGYLAMRGDVVPVRLVEADGEPDDEEANA